jgi:hypothetical protein
MFRRMIKHAPPASTMALWALAAFAAALAWALLASVSVF